MKMDRNHGCFASPKGFQQRIGLVYDCVSRVPCLFEYDYYGICVYYMRVWPSQKDKLNTLVRVLNENLIFLFLNQNIC